MSLARISATCKGFPGASDGKESTCILYHLIGKILWRRKRQPTCLENSMDRGVCVCVCVCVWQSKRN